MEPTMDQLAAALKENSSWLMKQPGIKGGHIAKNAQDQHVLMLYANQTPDATKQAIRERLKGYPVEFLEGMQIELRKSAL